VDCSLYASASDCLSSFNEYQYQTYEHFYDHLDDILVLTKTQHFQLHTLRRLTEAHNATESALESINSAQTSMAIISSLQEELLNLTLPQFQLLASVLNVRLSSRQYKGHLSHCVLLLIQSNIRDLSDHIIVTADLIELLALKFKIAVEAPIRPFIDASIIGAIIGVTYSWNIFFVILLPSILLGCLAWYLNSLQILTGLPIFFPTSPHLQYMLVSTVIWFGVICHLVRSRGTQSKELNHR